MVDSDSDQFSVQRRLHHAKQVQRVVLWACPDHMLFQFQADNQKIMQSTNLYKCYLSHDVASGSDITPCN